VQFSIRGKRRTTSSGANSQEGASRFTVEWGKNVFDEGLSSSQKGKDGGITLREGKKLSSRGNSEPWREEF